MDFVKGGSSRRRKKMVEAEEQGKENPVFIVYDPLDFLCFSYKYQQYHKHSRLKSFTQQGT